MKIEKVYLCPLIKIKISCSLSFFSKILLVAMKNKLNPNQHTEKNNNSINRFSLRTFPHQG